MTYTFDKVKHVHTLDGKPLMGVTTVLSVINKPALVQWSANQACDHIISRWGENGLTTDELMVAIKEARLAHRRKKEKAGDWGTVVHEAIEKWVKTGSLPSLTEDQEKAVGHFIKWVTDNKITVLASEKNVWSREHWIGGIFDLVLEWEGKKYIADIKTSSGIYNEHFFQMAAYNICLDEMGEGHDIAGYIVINLKKDGTVDFKKSENMDINKQAFLSALSLYKIINSLT